VLSSRTHKTLILIFTFEPYIYIHALARACVCVKYMVYFMQVSGEFDTSAVL